MTKLLAIAALGLAVLLPNAPAFAQQQGSNQSADYALSWSAAAGGYGRSANAYAQYGYAHYSHHRHWR